VINPLLDIQIFLGFYYNTIARAYKFIIQIIRRLQELFTKTNFQKENRILVFLSRTKINSTKTKVSYQIIIISSDRRSVTKAIRRNSSIDTRNTWYHII
jgi:hypothetical protein